MGCVEARSVLLFESFWGFGLWGPLLGASVSRVYCPTPSVGIVLFSLAATSALDSG